VKESEYPGHITNETWREMKEWILHHLHYQFLTKEEEDYFMAKYGILRHQVKTAFNNRRQQIVAPMHLVKQNEFQQQILKQLIAFGITISFLRIQTQR
jgi:hypothetical protein